MRFLLIFFNRLKRTSLGQDLKEALARNEEAAEALDQAVKEVLKR